MSRPSVVPTFSQLLSTFWRIGLLSFGGPAGQIALMHRELVEERGWVSEDDYLHALNFCHLLPGPEAQQLATWVGWRLQGWRGGLAAGLLEADLFVAGTRAQDGNDRFIFDRASGQLWFDGDGAGGDAQRLVATFEQNAQVTASDIEIF